MHGLGDRAHELRLGQQLIDQLAEQWATVRPIAVFPVECIGDVACDADRVSAPAQHLLGRRRHSGVHRQPVSLLQVDRENVGAIAGLQRNGLVYLEAAGVFTIGWGVSTVMRDLLGFTGSLAGATRYEAPNKSPLLWMPGKPETPMMQRLGVEPRDQQLGARRFRHPGGRGRRGCRRCRGCQSRKVRPSAAIASRRAGGVKRSP